MLKLGLEKSISLALVMMIAIMEIKGDEFLAYALLRFLTIIIGVLAAFAVNLFFMPPKYETKLFQSIHQAQDEIIRWTRLAGRQASEHVATKKSLNKLKDRLTQVDQLYVSLKKNGATSKKALRVKRKKTCYLSTDDCYFEKQLRCAEKTSSV